MSSKRHDFEKITEKRPEIELLYIARSSYSEDWNSIQHTHTNLELFYILKGKSKFSIGNKTFIVNQKDLIIINPQILHTEYPINGETIEYVVLGINKLEFYREDSTASHSNPDYMIINLASKKFEIEMFFQIIFNEIRSKKQGYNLLAQNAAEAIITLINRYADINFDNTETNIKNKECITLHNYIDEHFKENISLDLLANLIHMNKYYIAHEFKKAYNISPMNYVTYKRIEESKHLLIQADYSLSRISDILGFSSSSYFTQTFKKSVGIPPREYRNLYKNT